MTFRRGARTAANIGVGAALWAACGTAERTMPMSDDPSINDQLAKYATFELTADISALSDREQALVAKLVEAARPLDAVFWQQTYGNLDSLLESVADPGLRRLVEINYGPWDRLGDNAVLVDGVGPKPAGANLYPADMSRAEFQAALDAPAERADALRSLYTLIRRGPDRSLVPVPYHEAFAEYVEVTAARLAEAAQLADDPGLKRYLELRSRAILTDDYRESDVAWMDMKTNPVDVVIGPIETYEDQLFGYKAGYEAYVLVKDREWSGRLQRYAAVLPALQRGLPVADEYKREMPGTNSDLNAYDVVFVAGEANTGSKTIAINLPNDETVQLEKGTRRLQLKNVIRAKFDSILVRISDVLIAEDQRPHVTFDAFFGNTMFHEVAHGLGVKNTINGRGTVREALREHYSPFEEGKADILGLYMVTQLITDGVEPADPRDHYVTFLASIFRSIRFGASSAHGRANMVRFNYFQDEGAFTRDDTGTYRVDFDRMETAMGSLSNLILTLQGDGDYEGVGELLETLGVIRPDVQADLDRLSERGIPVDIVYEQGTSRR